MRHRGGYEYIFSSPSTVEVTDSPNHIPATKTVKSGLEISQSGDRMTLGWGLTSLWVQQYCTVTTEAVAWMKHPYPQVNQTVVLLFFCRRCKCSFTQGQKQETWYTITSVRLLVMTLQLCRKIRSEISYSRIPATFLEQIGFYLTFSKTCFA